MNPTLLLWAHVFGSLALETALVVGLAAAVQPFLRSARWKHAAWLTALVGVSLVFANAWFGVDRQIGDWIRERGTNRVQYIVRGNLPVSGPAMAVSGASLAAGGAVPGADTAAGTDAAERAWWPAWVWLAGALILATRTVVARCWLARVWCRRQGRGSPEAGGRVAVLARRLGLRRRVRVLSGKSLSGPITFGWVRPTIALPEDFWTAHSRAGQDAMLLHELAHLAARDPLWLGLADLATTVLWWHPLVWWARHQFRAACESAADEASLLLEDGPAVLADCLVSLAARLQQPRASGWLGMAGFRSGLGRRVERLLRLRTGGFERRRGGALVWALTAGGLLVAALALLVTARAMPASPGQPTLLALAEAAVTPAAPPQDGASPPAEASAAPLAPVELGSPSESGPEFSLPATLLVQLRDQAPAERRGRVAASMDVLVRRLFATRQFRWVKCEPVEPDQIRVSLLARDTNAWSSLTSLVEERGWFEFRKVHPESREMAMRNLCPAGYEALPERVAPGQAGRTFIVEADPAEGLTSRDVRRTGLRIDPLSSRVRVSLEFTPEGAESLHRLTGASVGRELAMVLDGQVLMAPRINEPIGGDACEISGDFSEADAGRMAALLQAPLPTPLKVVEATFSGVAPSRSATGANHVTAPVDNGRPLVQDAKPPRPRSIEEARAAGGAPSSKALQRDFGFGFDLGFMARTNPGAPAEPGPGGDAATAGAGGLLTRTYRLSTNALMANLRSVGGFDTNQAPAELIRRFLAAAGVDLGADTSSGRGAVPGGKSLFYSATSGRLLVRATAPDLETIESALQVLNAAPPQVTIEARFVEIADSDSRALGFDWYLGNTMMGPGATNTGTMTSGPVTVTGLRSDPQFRAVGPAFLQTGGTGVFPGATASTSPGASNGVRELRGDQLDWAGKDAAHATNIRLTAATGATMTGLLTDPQFRVVLRALDQRSGVDVLCAPKVTTLSGRQAQIQIVELKTVPTLINPAALFQPDAPPGTNVPPFSTAQIPVGPVLDIVPVVSADGYTIQLRVVASVTEFLGYDPPPKDGKVRIWQDGKPKWVDQPLPRFRVRQVQSQAEVWDGQTLVLGAYPVADQIRTQDKVPVLGDLPLAGGLFRSESQSTVRKRLVVFITPVITDPAGNRVHAANNLPYDPNRVPAPVPR